MKLLDIYDCILSSDGNFTSCELAERTGTSAAQVSKALARLAKQGKVIKISRGKWTLLTKTNRLRLPEFVANAPAYCTAHTALFHHGMIDQIPTAIYAATTGRTKQIRTPFGPIQLHRISENLFTGWDENDGKFKMASPEKALVDYFYLAITGHPHFKTLPEVEIPKKFQWSKAKRYTKRISNRAWRNAVDEKLNTQRETSAVLAETDTAEV